MIVLLIAALAVVAVLLVGGGRIARSRARERQRRGRLEGARRVAAEARAEEERRRAAVDASDALTSVIPAIKMPWVTQLPRFGEHGDGALPPGTRPGEYPAPGARANEHVVPAPWPGEDGLPADHPRRRVGQGSHRGGHGKRHRG